MTPEQRAYAATPSIYMFMAQVGMRIMSAENAKNEAEFGIHGMLNMLRRLDEAYRSGDEVAMAKEMADVHDLIGCRG